MWSLLASLLAELRGMRRALLTLAILFLVIVLGPSAPITL